MKRRDTIVRYTAPERINHWITAFCFILAAVSGLGFLFPSFNWLMQIMGTPQLARILHPFVGVVMFASFIIMFFRYWHHNLINRSGVNCGYHGAYLRRPLGERHDYRHGGRMGDQRMGKETSPALVP